MKNNVSKRGAFTQLRNLQFFLDARCPCDIPTAPHPTQVRFLHMHLAKLAHKKMILDPLFWYVAKDGRLLLFQYVTVAHQEADPRLWFGPANDYTRFIYCDLERPSHQMGNLFGGRRFVTLHPAPIRPQMWKCLCGKKVAPQVGVNNRTAVTS